MSQAEASARPAVGARGLMVLRVVIALILVVGAVEIVARCYTDYVWFDSLGLRSVLTVRWATQLLAALSAGAIDTLWVGANLSLAYRLRPVLRTQQVSAVVLHYRAVFDQRRRAAIWLPAAFVGVWGALSAAAQWQQILAFHQQTPFGVQDPYLGHDVGFYVFTYPILRYCVSHLLVVSLVVLVASAAAHVAVGGLIVPRKSAPVRRRLDARAHLSVLLAACLVWVGFSALLDRYAYAITDGGDFTGVSYTDATVRLTAKLVLAWLCFLCAVGFAVNASLRRWSIGWIAVALLVVTNAVLLGVYPAVVQRLSVEPSHAAVSTPYVAAHLQATNAAFGLDAVRTQTIAAAPKASDPLLQQQIAALAGTRVADPTISAGTLQRQVSQASWDRIFAPLSVGHAAAADGGGSQHGVDTLSGQHVTTLSLQANTSWADQHVIYVRGQSAGTQLAATGASENGSAQAAGSSSSGDYIGPHFDSYAVVFTPSPVTTVTGYSGKALTITGSKVVGPSLDNFMQRAMWALRLADRHLLTVTPASLGESGADNASTTMLYQRTLNQRLTALAPWITWDSQPTLAATPATQNTAGTSSWIVAGYTTTANYPNSQQLNWGTALSSSTSSQSQLTNPAGASTVNYVRHAVTAVVNASTGVVNMYANDTADPILRTWEHVYPDVVQPFDAMPAALRAQSYYPSDLFTVQQAIVSNYHTDDAAAWLAGADRWTPATDPTRVSPPVGQTTSAQVVIPAQPQSAQYFSTVWPGQKSAAFTVSGTLTDASGDQLRGWFGVDASASGAQSAHPTLLTLSDADAPGPGKVLATLRSDPAVEVLLQPPASGNTSGNKPQPGSLGSLLAMPLAGGLVWAAPIYATVTSERGDYPELRAVAVLAGGQVGVGKNLVEALRQVFPAHPVVQGTGVEAARALLAQAAAAYAAADAALAQGDLTTYAQQLTLGRQRSAAAQKALG